MESVSHHGRETRYRIHDLNGDGEPVVFVHGSGGTHRVWKSQSRLARDRPVVALDLSGHGDSTDVDADAGWGTLSAYASDVIAVAEETEARLLVGNSLGGAVLLHIALYRDFDPHAMVLAGSGARMAVLEDLLVWLQEDFDRAVEFLHQPNRLFVSPDPALIELSQSAMYACGQSVTARDFFTCHRFDVRDELDRIDIPCLALTGGQDQLTPPWYHEYMAERLPHGEWTTISNAAHLAMLERPDTFNAELTGFFERV